LQNRYGDSWVDPGSFNEDNEIIKQQGREETEKNLQKRFMTSEYEDVDPTPEKDKEEDADHRLQLVKNANQELKVQKIINEIKVK
jgi:hypothetical protein